MDKRISVFNNIDELSQFFGELIVSQMQGLPEWVYYSIALSGGSTPKAIFQYLAQHFHDQIQWKKVQLFWSDERCVSPDSPESNFRMTKENLLDLVAIPQENIFRIRGESDPVFEAGRYAATVRQQLRAVNNIPQFDLLMLGLGEDGHTASIFPGNLHLFESKYLFEIAKHPQSGQVRVTATGKIINAARAVTFLTTGESKSDIIATLFEKKKGWDSLPASKVQPENGTLYWLLDKKSASKIATIQK